MNEETIKEIFLEIAFRAMETGKEITLEKGKDASVSKAFNGVIMDSQKDYDSLVLRVFTPVAEEEEAEE